MQELYHQPCQATCNLRPFRFPLQVTTTRMRTSFPSTPVSIRMHLGQTAGGRRRPKHPAHIGIRICKASHPLPSDPNRPEKSRISTLKTQSVYVRTVNTECWGPSPNPEDQTVHPQTLQTVILGSRSETNQDPRHHKRTQATMESHSALNVTSLT